MRWTTINYAYFNLNTVFFLLNFNEQMNKILNISLVIIVVHFGID